MTNFSYSTKNRCYICGRKDKLQYHHILYQPISVTIRLCRFCHAKIHNHGTGSGFGEWKKYPIRIYPFRIFEDFSKDWEKLTNEQLSQKYKVSVMTLYKWKDWFNLPSKRLIKPEKTELTIYIRKEVLKYIDKIRDYMYDEIRKSLNKRNLSKGDIIEYSLKTVYETIPKIRLRE